ncbi:timeless protein-domain-containing protein [Gorgonomyces haynaldii]|nr:timeless protein-domain-containing protein [Gorgonomyces haynaldii]
MIGEEEDFVYFSNHLLAVCSAIGGFEKDPEKGMVYKPGDEVFDEEMKQRHTQMLLGKWNVIDSDLIPLLLHTVEDNKKLALSEVLVPLTWPIEDPTKEEKHILLQLKSSFARKGVWQAVLQVMLTLFAIPFAERLERDHARLRLLVCLVRNILYIEDPQIAIESSNNGFNHALLQEKIVTLMQEEKILDLIMSLSASSGDREFFGWVPVLAEIVYLIYRDRADQKQQENTLEKLLSAEKSKSKPKSSRHARFGGAFSIQTVRSIIPEIQSKDKNGKKLVRKTRNLINGRQRRHFSSNNSKNVFEMFAKDFLKNAAPFLLMAVKKHVDLDTGAVKEEHFKHFFFLLSFFLELVGKTDKSLLQSEDFMPLVDTPVMLLVFRRLIIYKDEKLNQMIFLVLNCLRYTFVIWSDLLQQENMRDTCHQIMSQVFYEETFVYSISGTMRQLSTLVLPRDYLEALIETFHLLLNTLQRYSAVEQGLVVKRKTKTDEDMEEEEKGAPQEKLLTFESFEYVGWLMLGYISKLYLTVIEAKARKPLFYRASLFETFSGVSSKRRSLPEYFVPLLEIIDGIVASFVKGVQERPSLTFFIKTLADCRRIDDSDITSGPEHHTADHKGSQPFLDWLKQSFELIMQDSVDTRFEEYLDQFATDQVFDVFEKFIKHKETITLLSAMGFIKAHDTIDINLMQQFTTALLDKPQKKTKEQIESMLSEQFVFDSDDDTGDAQFFALEAKRRLENEKRFESFIDISKALQKEEQISPVERELQQRSQKKS